VKESDVSLQTDQEVLGIAERISGQVILAEAEPGIDISPLIDMLMQFLLELLNDCPAREIRRAVDESASRPVVNRFWRLRVQARLPVDVRRQVRQAPKAILEAGTALTEADWKVLGA
jgi:hypothetical protein